MMTEQMELSLSNVRACQSASRRQRRLNRANWWFAQMRQVVDRAFDWQPAPEPRPEQIWIPQSYRKIDLKNDPNTSGEIQVCE